MLARFRHPLLQRALAGALLMGVLSGVSHVAVARPADRYAAWLRDQADGEFRALVDAALRLTILPPAPTPGEFLAGYATAQARLAPSPTGALFGFSDLTLLQALGRLEGRMTGLSAPPAPGALAALTTVAPVLPLGGTSTPPPASARTRVTARHAPALPHGAPVWTPRLLYGVSAAQPLGP